MSSNSNHVLSKRELTVLELISKGHSSKGIAESLHISLLTVQTHRRNMLKKLKLQNSHQLVSWAFKNKLLHSLIPWTSLFLAVAGTIGDQ